MLEGSARLRKFTAREPQQQTLQNLMLSLKIHDMYQYNILAGIIRGEEGTTLKEKLQLDNNKLYN